MSAELDPAPERTAWHEWLAQRDQQRHDEEHERSVAHAVEALEVRLARAEARVHTLREGIALRDALLEQQRLHVRHLERRVEAATSSPSPVARRWRRLHPRRIARRLRRELGSLRSRLT